MPFLMLYLTAIKREMSECTFKPHREGAQTSEKYLKRIGRRTASPEDFMRYHEVIICNQFIRYIDVYYRIK